MLCYDTRLNKQSYSCADHEKPPTKKACIPPPNCECDLNTHHSEIVKIILWCYAGSCKGLHSRGIYKDGEYDLLVRGRNVSIYCNEMNTSNPTEYITVNQGKSLTFWGRSQITSGLQGRFDKKRTLHRAPVFHYIFVDNRKWQESGRLLTGDWCIYSTFSKCSPLILAYAEWVVEWEYWACIVCQWPLTAHCKTESSF